MTVKNKLGILELIKKKADSLQEQDFYHADHSTYLPLFFSYYTFYLTLLHFLFNSLTLLI